MAFIEGIGDEVIIAFVFAFLLEMLIAYYLYKKVDRNDLYDEDFPMNNAPPVHNPHTCPICWGEQVLPLETNCGHLYCGSCLKTLHRQNLQAIRYGISCPMCRQQVNLLFVCFTNEERQASDGSELAFQRDDILSFARSYNQSFSTGSRSIWSQIRDLPILVRHFFNDAIRGENFENTYLNVRLFLVSSISLAYLLIPMDLLPEHAFGFIGLIDDVILLLVLMLYAAASYRRFVADRPLLTTLAD